jgi:N utilization substance protein B
MAADRPVATARREARERALHLLYEAEVRGLPPQGVLDDQILAPDAFTARLVGGVGEHLGELDGLITETSHTWSLERMPAMDRAVLRLGAYELVHEPETPTAVVIDEAVELAKQYSTEDSGRFVNGVLSSIAATSRGTGPSD